ncbi:acetate--CoA ligase [Bryobacter aggregatus]|uniref:acetate--CoA ligase n=1 Tax=Bryobacter aggregatus TaxID=360054 RepID=UPI0004E20745|nr:acetate--CoA ligase [Bryobacter aggregatus]
MSQANIYPPSADFVKQANVSGMEAYRALYQKAADKPEEFWGELAKEKLHWMEPFSHVFEWEPPFVKWFVGGKLNACYNCVDRHVGEGNGDKVALLFEGEPGDSRRITYSELLKDVSRFANGLLRLGIETGDRAIIYMPMIPEAVIAMLACARLGITHSVVFGGFSAEALKARIQDLGAKLVITADGGWRKGKEVKLKPAVDEALADCPSVTSVVVCERTKTPVPMVHGRDHYWQAVEAGQSEHCPAVPLDSEHPLFVLYTSGTTGKPKGILHTTGGYLLQCAMTVEWVFDLKKNDVYWCTADIGWVTGHSYVTYGPMALGATQVIYEGSPDTPGFDRWWAIVEKYKVSILYTSPTAIRALIRQGDHLPNAHNLSSLRLLGSVGEPINPAAWEWFYKVIGKERCPIVDTWWQTETGAMLIAPMPGAVPLKPGSGTLPIPGVMAEVVNLDGKPVGPNEEGYLIVSRPWPSMVRTIWGDPKRFEDQYWSRVPGKYFTGDAARRDEDGYFWVLGRVDDVLNVSGHRLSTMEVESALVRHPAVAEAAVVGKPHEITGQAVCCFITLKKGEYDHDVLSKELRQWIAHEIGAFARPEEIRFSEALPKTRSGKIMRRLLRELVTNNTVAGDVTTLEDLSVITKLAAQQDDES